MNTTYSMCLVLMAAALVASLLRGGRRIETAGSG
jgi:hypothetical protein